MRAEHLYQCAAGKREMFLNFQKCLGKKASKSLSCSILNLSFHTWKYNTGVIYTFLAFERIIKLPCALMSLGLFKMPRALKALMNRCTYHPSICVGETEKNDYEFYS